ncbi:MAG: hypothetical protein H6R13_3015 [Proteobacteria bacterium]|nr:hypothetical protein [Pseudomonadota bacterium]
MSLSLSLPGLSISISRSSAYVHLAGLLEVSLTGSGEGSPLLGASWFEVGGGFNLLAGPLSLDIGKA